MSHISPKSQHSRAEEVAEGVLSSPLFYLSIFVLIAGTLTNLGMWTDKDYDLGKLFQIQIILPITALSLLMNAIHYWRYIEEHNKQLKAILVLFIAYSACMLQFMPLGLHMLDFIFTAAKANSHLVLSNETEEKAFEQRSILVLVLAIIVFPLLEWLAFRSMENRQRLADKLSFLIAKNSDY